MSETVPVTFEVDAKAASALQDPAIHAFVQKVIQRTTHRAKLQELFDLMDEISAEARRRGLTDEILEEELAAYNAERRERTTPPAP